MYILLDIIMRFVEITPTIVKKNKTKNIAENNTFLLHTLQPEVDVKRYIQNTLW